MKIPKSKVSKGEGKTVASDGQHPVAVYHGEDDTFVVLSADCPHAHCDVAWNAYDKTWDCPCHGSRFKKDGSLQDGPATEGLKKLPVKDLGEELDVDYHGEELH